MSTAPFKSEGSRSDSRLICPKPVAVISEKMSTLPRSTGSFKKLRVVRLVTQLFRRRRRKSAKEPRTSFVSISSPTPILTNFSTMSLIIHCRHLSRSGDLDYSLASSPSCELVMSGSVFADDDKSTSYCEGDLNEADSVGPRSVSHDSVFQPDSFRPGRMLRNSSRPSSRNFGKTGNGTASSLVDVSDGGLRAELENKVFIRAKRMNSGTNDPAGAVQRSRSNTSPMPIDLPHDEDRSGMHYWSGSVVDLDEQRGQMTRESLRASYYTVSEMGTAQLNYRKLPSLDNNIPLPTSSLTLPVSYATQTLSNDAAKHRIAVKPKNRRPKSYQAKLEMEVAPKPAARFSDPTDTIVTSTTQNYANNTTATDALTAELATVLSEVEATYELFNIPAVPAPLEPPQPVVRKLSATMTYSKSFHIPRRPFENASNTLFPAKPFVSPRLTRAKTTDPPPIPPKTFKSNDNEFAHVLTKFHRHIEPGQYSADEASSSGTLTASLISQQTSLRKNTFNPAQVQDKPDIMDACDPLTTPDRLLPPVSSSLISNAVGPLAGDIVSAKMKPLTLPPLPPIPVDKASPEVPAENKDLAIRSADCNKRIDEVSRPSSVYLGEATVPKLIASGPPLISPKPRLRLRTNLTRNESGEQELMKVLAKRNSDLELNNTLSSFGADTYVKTPLADNAVKRAPSFRLDADRPKVAKFERNLQPENTGNPPKTDNELADKENQPIERQPAKRHSQAELTAELRRNFFSSDKNGDTKLLRERSTASSRSASLDKVETFLPALATVASTLRKVSLSEIKECSTNSVPAEWGPLLRKISTENNSNRDADSNPSFTSSLRRSSLKPVEPGDKHGESAPVFPVNLKKVPSVSRKEEVPAVRKEIIPKQSVDVTIIQRETGPSTSSTAVSAREDEPPDSGRSSVISRAALFQSKVGSWKPVSPRFDTDKNGSSSASARTIPIPKARTLAQPFAAVPGSCESSAEIFPKASTFSGAQLQATMWSSPITVPPLKPVLPMKMTTTKPVLQPTSCGSAAGNSEVPSWVLLAQEKRKRLNMLSDSSEFAKANNSGLSSKEMQIVNASFA